LAKIEVASIESLSIRSSNDYEKQKSIDPLILVQIWKRIFELFAKQILSWRNKPETGLDDELWPMILKTIKSNGGKESEVDAEV
jgi:hypothetical protein